MTIRPATPEDAEAITTVHLSAWRSAYRDLLPAPYLRDLDHHERLEQWRSALPRQDIGVFVAEDEHTGELVGFTNCGPNRDPGDLAHPGELYAIYLVETAKHRGTGHALFTAARRWLQGHRLTPFVLWVLENNTAARAFYEREGGRRAEGRPIELGGETYTELAYLYES